MDGIFGVNKPVGITSHDVVNLVRKKTGVKRVGHGGTLDPLAEGVLVIAVGRQNTKLLEQYVKGEKEYVAQIKLGFDSTTDDEDGEKKEINTVIKPNIKDVKAILKKFVGKIEQIPPVYSSIKLSGKPAHRRARRGQKVELKARTVNVKKIKLISYDFPIIKIKVATGPGVYIRSLARDIGKELKTGGYLKSLIRTKVANFTVEKSLPVEDLKNL